MQFSELNVIPSILKALEKENYEAPTPIQEKAIPIILSGKDLLGCAQTGTGKTAAFAIPTLQLLSEDTQPTTKHRNIRALIITPTRELALQIYESFCTYGKYTNLKCCVIFGGVSQKPQETALQEGVDILVATPGRLNDLINQKLIDLMQIELFILDEADRMLDMGFINDVNKIIAKLPVKKQTLLFSATMPPAIAALSNTILYKPVRIDITPVSSTVDSIDQYLYYVDKVNKKDLLLHLLKDKSIVSALVFTRTKHGADRIARQLGKEKVTAQAIHGDKSQGARQHALSEFKNRTLRVLVATDIAARGIDIDELSHVINYELPNVPETYVHRIGRTGRAGLGGVAISFCDFDEKELLSDIEQLIGKQITEVKDHPYPLLNNFPAVKTTQPRRESSRKAISQITSPRDHKSQIIRRQKDVTQNVSSTETSKSMTLKSNSTKSTAKGTKTWNAKASGTKTLGAKTVGPKASGTKTSGTKIWTAADSTTKSYDTKATTGKSSFRNASTKKSVPAKQSSTQKKKFIMSADGTLKEKKNYFTPFHKRGK